jgi:hypothetical protein
MMFVFQAVWSHERITTRFSANIEGVRVASYCLDTFTPFLYKFPGRLKNGRLSLSLNVRFCDYL